MAAIRFVTIRDNVGGCLRYIATMEKMIPEENYEVFAMFSCAGEADGIGRVYSHGRHCSSNASLAAAQIRLHRARYLESRNGAGIQGLAEGKRDMLGLHIFISYSEADDPSEEKMNYVIRKVAEEPKFRDFAFFWAHHYNRPNKHTHIFISAYSAEGIPRKLCLRNKDYDDLRKHLNKLCYELGLSIIDLSRLRHRDPEYSEWIDRVILEGKVVVHPEKEEHKRFPKQKISTRSLYFRWMREQAERAEESEKRLTDMQRKKKHFESTYFYTPDGDENKRWYVTNDPQHRFYTVSRQSSDGYRRSGIELVVRLVLFIAGSEGAYIKENDPVLWLKYNAKIETKLQGMLDCISTANKMKINNASQIPNRIAYVCRKMNAFRKEKVRHEANITSQRRIITAYERYSSIHSLDEGIKKPTSEDSAELISTYEVLAQNQILSSDAYMALCRRHAFEMKKLADYRRRMSELAKQYYDLKKLEAFTANPVGILEEIYGYSSLAQSKAAPHAGRRKSADYEQEL